MSEADFLLFNARVWTADPACPHADAVAVAGERVALVGSNRQVLQAYPSARRLDARNLTILPGFIDAHVHVVGLGEHLMQIDLFETASAVEAANKVAEVSAGDADDGWIIGGGWDHNRWDPPQFPDRGLLDERIPHRPVWLRRTDLHVGWANSAALQAAGIDASTPDVNGGIIVRDDRGEPTGILVDRAMEYVERVLPVPDVTRKRRCIEQAVNAFHAAGITGVHDAGTPADVIDVYRAMIDEDALDLRLYAMADGRSAAYDRICADGSFETYRNRLSVRAVKFFMDGALGSRGAALLQDYTDEPGNRGLLMYAPEAFTQLVREASECGLQVCTHAIGDGAVRQVLDAYEEGMTPEQRATLRPRVEHAQVVHPEDVPRFSQLQIVASMQPVHRMQDRHWAAERLGVERGNTAYRWDALRENGAHLAFGSDAPVASPNPLAGVAEASTSMDREDALRAFTIDAARAGFQEDLIGSITAGKMADFVVLADDPLQVSSGSTFLPRVVATFVGGKCVFGGW